MNEHNSAKNLFPNTRKLARLHLKRCPLCNALNSIANEECFVCCWHGAFIHDSEQIEQGLSALLRRCPEYRSQRLTLPKSAPQGPMRTWRFLLRRVLKGPLDYRV